MQLCGRGSSVAIHAVPQRGALQPVLKSSRDQIRSTRRTADTRNSHTISTIGWDAGARHSTSLAILSGPPLKEAHLPTLTWGISSLKRRAGSLVLQSTLICFGTVPSILSRWQKEIEWGSPLPFSSTPTNGPPKSITIKEHRLSPFKDTKKFSTQ
jgi:hypothetical protein